MLEEQYFREYRQMNIWNNTPPEYRLCNNSEKGQHRLQKKTETKRVPKIFRNRFDNNFLQQIIENQWRSGKRSNE